MQNQSAGKRIKKRIPALLCFIRNSESGTLCSELRKKILDIPYVLLEILINITLRTVEAVWKLREKYIPKY